jgi:hypothetical protein
MRFYTYVITNVFIERGVYDLLMNDIIMYGQPNNDQSNN